MKVANTTKLQWRILCCSLAHEGENNRLLSHENFFRTTSLCEIPGDNGEGNLIQLIKLMSEDDQKIFNQIIVYNVLHLITYTHYICMYISV